MVAPDEGNAVCLRAIGTVSYSHPAMKAIRKKISRIRLLVVQGRAESVNRTVLYHKGLCQLVRRKSDITLASALAHWRYPACGFPAPSRHVANARARHARYWATRMRCRPQRKRLFIGP